MESPRPEKALNRPMSHYYVSYYFIRQPQTKAKSRPESRFIATNNPIHRLLLLLLLLLLVESGYLVANYYTTTIIIISPRSPSSRRPLRICVYAHALIETVGMYIIAKKSNQRSCGNSTARGEEIDQKLIIPDHHHRIDCTFHGRLLDHYHN